MTFAPGWYLHELQGRQHVPSLPSSMKGHQICSCGMLWLLLQGKMQKIPRPPKRWPWGSLGQGMNHRFQMISDGLNVWKLNVSNAFQSNFGRPAKKPGEPWKSNRFGSQCTLHFARLCRSDKKRKPERHATCCCEMKSSKFHELPLLVADGWRPEKPSASKRGATGMLKWTIIQFVKPKVLLGVQHARRIMQGRASKRKAMQQASSWVNNPLQSPLRPLAFTWQALFGDDDAEFWENMDSQEDSQPKEDSETKKRDRRKPSIWKLVSPSAWLVFSEKSWCAASSSHVCLSLLHAQGDAKMRGLLFGDLDEEETQLDKIDVLTIPKRSNKYSFD